jgi:hypothetical protein
MPDNAGIEEMFRGEIRKAQLFPYVKPRLMPR